MERRQRRLRQQSGLASGNFSVNENKGSLFNALSRMDEECADITAKDPVTFHFEHKSQFGDLMTSMDTGNNGKFAADFSAVDANPSKGAGVSNSKNKPNRLKLRPRKKKQSQNSMGVVGIRSGHRKEGVGPIGEWVKGVRE